GVVYKALHLKLNRIVAVKMLLAGGYASQTELQRFRAEAEAVAALQHPNIVQIFEVDQHEGLLYFTLEFMGRGSLAKRVRGELLGPAEAATLMEEVARGVAFAHSKGLIHRDLKPDNILLTDEGMPKITDFGLVKRLPSDVAAGVSVGESLTETGAIL